MSLEKKLITASILACNIMSAVEITIVTTAIPSIVKDLSGFNLSSYVFSVFLLTSVLATTVFGKLSDIYGKKMLLQISTLIFLIGSLLCGLSRSMVFLIFARSIQGIGSGALATLTLAVIGDIFEVEERAVITGYTSTAWSLASLVGPLLGGVILLRLSWHWIFFINIPIGLISIFLIKRYYHFESKNSKETLDVKGLIFITLFVIFLIQSMTSLEKHSFISFNVLGQLVLSIFFLAIFVRVERNVESPILPYKLFNKVIVIVMIITFLNSAVLIAVDVYNPAFIQNVQDYIPIYSTVPILSLSGAWVISAFILSKVISKLSTRSILTISLGLIAIGCMGLVLLKPNSNLIQMSLSSIIIGFGFGWSYSLLLFIVQESLSKNNMGIASGAVLFMRNLGQTIGISAFGVSLNNSVQEYFNKLKINVNMGSILESTSLKKIDVSNSLFIGYNKIYILCFILGLICVVVAFLLPKNKKLNEYN